jgi:DNA-binding transcriptional MerR regulator
LTSSAHTLRYYERAGLIEPVARTPTGHRRYARADLEHLQFLHCLRATGMSIRRMQEFAALVRQGESARPAGRPGLRRGGGQLCQLVGVGGR